MRDCENAKVRDQLPDLLFGRLTADGRAEVEAHVASCADCSAEFALLRQVQAAIVAPRIDATKVSAAVPAYRRRSAWSAAAHSWPLRAAAAVVLVVGAASILRDGAGRGDTLDTTFAAAAAAGAELSVGGLTDLPDTDLQALLDGMAKLDAVTPAEPDVIVVPAVGRSGSEP